MKESKQQEKCQRNSIEFEFLNISKPLCNLPDFPLCYRYCGNVLPCGKAAGVDNMSNLIDVVSNGDELTPYLGIFGKRSGSEVHAGNQHTEKYFHWEPPRARPDASGVHAPAHSSGAIF